MLQKDGNGLAKSFKECAELCDSTDYCTGFQYREEYKGNKDPHCNVLFTRRVTQEDNKYVPEWGLWRTENPDGSGGDKINNEAHHNYLVYEKVGCVETSKPML